MHYFKKCQVKNNYVGNALVMGRSRSPLVTKLSLVTRGLLPETEPLLMLINIKLLIIKDRKIYSRVLINYKKKPDWIPRIF